MKTVLAWLFLLAVLVIGFQPKDHCVPLKAYKLCGRQSLTRLHNAAQDLQYKAHLYEAQR